MVPLIAIAALDLRDGACAQLEGPKHAALLAQFGDPFAIAQTWAGFGFHRLHLADLDAASRRGSNEQLIEDVIRSASPLDVQVSGGVGSSDVIERLVQAGATQIVLGPRALEDGDWLSDQASLYPGVLVVSTDVRTQRDPIAGWVRHLPIDVVDLARQWSALPLAGILVTGARLTDAHRGSDLALLEDVASATALPVLVAGGIANMDDLRALDNRGVSAAVVGAALYSGELDPRRVAQEFAE